MRVLIIIPAFNEEEIIEKVVEEIIAMYPTYDYVIINDGSTDTTKEVCIIKKYHLIDLPLNTGLGVVNQTGFKYALSNDYDYCITFDGDGQHNPLYIKDLLNEAKKGNNLVIGSRFVKRKQGLRLRIFGSKILSLLIFFTTTKYIADPTSGFRCYDRVMMKFYENQINAAIEPDELVYLLRKNFKISEVEVQMRDRITGKSYFNPLSGSVFMINMIVSILFVQIFRDNR